MEGEGLDLVGVVVEEADSVGEVVGEVVLGANIVNVHCVLN